MDFVAKNTKETQAIAEDLAKKTGKGTVIALYGELGSGKTTFTSYFVKALGIGARVQSPTFVLARRYEGKDVSVNHIDLYRITSSEEALEMGIEELIHDDKAITLVEWPEMIEKILPKETVRIYFKHKSDDEREISIQNLS
jgi:tRNA threonylcarbamoyladenosine biosynthesis protein TsaE